MPPFRPDHHALSALGMSSLFQHSSKLLFHLLSKARHVHTSSHACTPRRLSSKDSDAIIRMFKERKTAKDMAGHLESTPSRVEGHIRRLRRAGLLTDRKYCPTQAPLTPTEVEILQTAKDDGKSLRDCAALIPNRPPSPLFTQFRRLRRMGTVVRPAATERQKWSVEETQKLVDLRGQGLQFHQIAELMMPRSVGSLARRFERIAPTESTRKTQPWTVAEINELRSCMRAGEKLKSISLRMGRTLESVRSKTNRLMLENEQYLGQAAPRIRWSLKDTARLCEMKSRKMKLTEIAQLLGRSPSSIISKWHDVEKRDKVLPQNTTRIK